MELLEYLLLLNTILLIILLIRTSKFLKKIIERFPHYLIFILCKYVPKQKNLVAFGGCYGYGFMGNPKPLFIEAQKDENIDAIWLAKNDDLVNNLRKQGYKAYNVYRIDGIVKSLRSKIVVMDNCIKEDFDYHYLKGAISFNTWHGVGLKQSWFRNVNAFSGKVLRMPRSIKKYFELKWVYTNMTDVNYVIATSEDVAAYYPETYQVSKEHVLNLGQARNDVFYTPVSKEELQELPECFKNGKVIVYMPTHRDYGARNKDCSDFEIGNKIDYNKLSKMLEKYGYKFVIKQHYWNSAVSAIGHKYYSNIIDISKNNYNIDTQILLKYTDILITDYSSCYTDFLLLNRPVLFFCYDLDSYLSKWDLNFEYDDVTPGPKCFNSDQLIEELEKILRGEDKYIGDRERVKNIFYSKDNQQLVSKKQIEFIKSLIK